MILYYDEDKDYDDIDEEKFGCVGVRPSSRYSRPVERLEPRWDNDK